MNLFIALRSGFPSDPDQVAIETTDGFTYSWNDLDRMSARIANLLQAMKLPKGARVAVQADKCVEMVMLYLAVLRVGGVFLPLDKACPKKEIRYFLEDAAPEILIYPDETASQMFELARELKITKVFTLNSNRTGTLLTGAMDFSDVHANVVDREDTPPEIVERLAKEVHLALGDDKFRQQLQAAVLEPAELSTCHGGMPLK